MHVRTSNASVLCKLELRRARLVVRSAECVGQSPRCVASDGHSMRKPPDSETPWQTSRQLMARLLHRFKHLLSFVGGHPKNKINLRHTFTRREREREKYTRPQNHQNELTKRPLRGSRVPATGRTPCGKRGSNAVRRLNRGSTVSMKCFSSSPMPGWKLLQ